MLMARLALLLTALLLAGCTSYRPLYGDGGAALTSQLGNIGIEETNDRAAQLVRNELLLSVRGEGSDGGYVLSLKPAEKRTQVEFDRTLALIGETQGEGAMRAFLDLGR